MPVICFEPAHQNNLNPESLRTRIRIIQINPTHEGQFSPHGYSYWRQQVSDKKKLHSKLNNCNVLKIWIFIMS